MTCIYQIPREVYNQFIEYLNAFKIEFKVLKDNSFPHTFGLIRVEAEHDVQDDIDTTLNKLIDYANKED